MQPKRHNTNFSVFDLNVSCLSACSSFRVMTWLNGEDIVGSNPDSGVTFLSLRVERSKCLVLLFLWNIGKKKRCAACYRHLWPYRPKWLALILSHNTECDNFRSAGKKYWFLVFIQIGCFRHFSVWKHYFWWSNAMFYDSFRHFKL